jgi:8-oxo-dGTP pyrophosphatase MutT (NUDIX family)
VPNLAPEVAAGLHARAMRSIANAPTRGSRAFLQGDFQVSYHAAPAIVEAVAAHLYYESRSPDPAGTRMPGWRVTCSVDADLWASTVDGLDVTWLPCLDYGDPGIIADIGTGRRLILSRTTRSILAVDHTEQAVSIVVPGPPSGFVESYKVVRHLLTTDVLRAGGWPLHASAIAVDGKVLAFCGHKGAGKSTALLHALLSRVPGLGYVANDRLLLQTDHEGRLWGRCWPTVAGFGPSLLASVPGLDDLVDARVHLRGGGLAYMLLDLPLVEHVGGTRDAQATPIKVRLTPSELTATFGVRASPGGRLATIVEVDLDLERATSTLTEVDDPAAKAAIVHEHLESVGTTHPDWLGVAQPHPAASDERDLAKALHDVRALWLAAGRDFHDVVRGLCSTVADGKFGVDPMPSWHYGVYAAAVVPSPTGPQVLTGRKNRGPYTGMLDLVGGAPEPGEDLDATLAREIVEETGAAISHTGPWRTFDLVVRSASDGRAIRLRHRGDWREAQLDGVTAPTKTDEDIDDLHWLPLDQWQTRDDLSAPLRHVLAALTDPPRPAP